MSSTAALSSKRVLYVGGLPDGATEDMIRAAFVPFGDIVNVFMPMDYVKGQHRGFCFIEMLEADDASEALFNMDGSELLSKTIRVSLAQPNQLSKLSATSTSSSSQQAIWNSDEWFQKQQQQQGGGGDDSKATKTETEQQQVDQKVLQEY